MHILIKSDVKIKGGFSTNEAVVVITNYSVTSNVTLVESSYPTPSDTNINARVLLYKSLADKVAGESAISSDNVSNDFNAILQDNSPVTEQSVYDLLLVKLTEKEHVATIVATTTSKAK